MTELHLDYLLQTVGERYRRHNTWRQLAFYWLAVSVVAFVVWGISTVAGYSTAYTMPLYLLAALSVGFLTYLVSRSRQHDAQWLARRIEAQHPDLNSLLLTAVEQREGLPGRMGYLQQTVIQQALNHARLHDWRDVVPDTKIHRAQYAHVASLLMMLGVTIWLWSINPRTAQAVISDEVATTNSSLADFEIQVDPGNVEVERGTGLVITARFGARMPVDVNLLTTRATTETESDDAPTDAAQTLPMQKSLDDPLFGARIGIVESDLTYTVEYDGQRTEEFQVTVFEYPRLLQADARIEFPSYTNQEPEIAEDVRQVTAVEGSTVTLSFALNKSVAQAVLVSDDGQNVPLSMTVDDSHEYVATLPMRESRNYTLQLTDAEGRKNKRPPLISLKVLPNRRPDIQLTFPGRDQRVSPLEEMLITGTINDDFGVVAHGVAYTIGDAQPQILTLSNQVQETQQISQQIRFEELGAQPDQLMSYYLWADDFDPDGQIRRTESDMYFAEVRHFEEIFRQGQSPPGGGGGPPGGAGGQGEKIGDLIKLQKDIVTATWKLRRNAAEIIAAKLFDEQLQVITQSQAQLLEKLSEVIAKLTDSESQQAAAIAQTHMTSAVERLNTVSAESAEPSLLTAYASERAAYQALLKLRAREHEVTKGQQGGGGGGGGGGRSQQQLQQLELADNENRYQNQSTAQSQTTDAQRETNQLVNRLRELAQRQNDLNERIQELQSALQAAKDEAERRELERRLKRLREDQREILRDADELRDRMQQSPQPQQAEAQQAQEQVNQTRENMHRSSEALEQGQLSQALNAGTRAQRQLQQLRDDFRKKSAGAFADDMQNMRDAARELAEEQQQVADELKALQEDKTKSLRDVRQKDQLAEKLKQQQQQLDDVLRQVRDVSQAAEDSEPLLSKQLYDTLRKTQQKQPGRALDATRLLLERGSAERATQAERIARDSIDELKTSVEQAAESVLGNETEALKRAKQELAELTEQLNNEIAQADPQQGQSPPGEGEQQQQQSGQSPPGQQKGNPPGKQPGQGKQPAQGQQSGQGQQPGGAQPGENSKSPSGQSPAGGGRGQNQRRSLRDRTPQQSAAQPTPGSPQQSSQSSTGGGPGGPITGSDFLQWSDRLRDVEEMVEDPALREQVATVRDRARSMRAEFRRHSKEPNWSLVESMVAQPLLELQDQLREEIAKRESPDALVPIDRDPVPPQYREIVRRYYERLGSGQ
ncbi:hypothetical protein Mal52_02330 [Symmachiella dynata]|uniref:Uncharacterized protein n=1 Tax=Symmachiella dynata TaxID=2527995 RepID=A0A517ZH53_9PLAN|nr:DUF4175 family protein [Symmachiella dynata]QDU41779.1 hypothetical protein Mal52_02330 [Symmachiella dynata]